MSNEATTRPASGAAAVDRASLRTMQQRRRRVLRNLTTFVIITALMVVLVIARRDALDVSRCEETLQKALPALQAEYDSRRSLPFNFPHPAGESLMPRAHYLYCPKNADARPAEVVGLVCCDTPHRLFLRSDGRHVLMLSNEGRLALRWMTEAEYQSRADVLRLPRDGAALGGP